MSDLLARLKKNSTIKDASILTKSILLHDKEFVQTKIPALNVALSGAIDGGFSSGLHLWCGPSKHFKSLFCLMQAKAYLDKYPEAILILFDAEFGIPLPYFTAVGIAHERVMHIPITNLEEFKFEIIKQIEGLERKDKVIMVVDSIGNLASIKEVTDAIDGKSTQDMTRARAITSLTRIITPLLTKKDIPCLMVNHVYSEMACVSGDTLIQTETGVRPISEIAVGDKVYTNNGLEIVEYAYKPSELPKEGKKFLQLTLSDGSTVKCTDNHQFLMSNGEWHNAGSFVVGSEFM